MPPGPDASVKITEAYARHVARDAFFWAWPLVNVYNSRRAAEQSTELAYAGPVPSAPLNRLAMLTDYVAPDERIVACPNQDVVYGGGSLGLEQSPVVIQVPDFGDRFWVYQAVDLRTDSFVQLGKMYGTTPGFYLLVGPNWRGEAPKGITLSSEPRPTPVSSPRASSWTTRRGSAGDPAGAAADHDVPAHRIRRHDEEHRLEHDQEIAERLDRRAGKRMGSARVIRRHVAGGLADAPPLPARRPGTLRSRCAWTRRRTIRSSRRR